HWMRANRHGAPCRSSSSICLALGRKAARTLPWRDAAGKSACCTSVRAAPCRPHCSQQRKRLITRQFCCRADERLIAFQPQEDPPSRFKVRRILAVVILAVSPLAARADKSDREALRKAVEQLLSQPPLSNAHVALQVESLDDGQVVYSRNPDDLLNPASNTKLVTAATGLLRLGPEYRFTTDYLTD